MHTALIREQMLTAPTVGTWTPRVGLGAPLTPGLVLGELVRAGRPAAVVAPDRVGGVVTHVAPAGSWLAFDDVLVEMGEGGGALATRPVASTRPLDMPDDVTPVVAETDGTVYLRPEPGAPAFAEPGSHVAALATIALVEVMKTFTPVRAPLAGEIVRVCVEDGAAIEAGAVLFWVRAG